MVGTISDVYLDLRNELRHHGVTSAQLEARELLAFALEIPGPSTSGAAAFCSTPSSNGWKS